MADNTKRPVKLIMQSDDSENAAAALAMVFSGFDKQITMKELSGFRLESASDIVAAAKRYGLYARGFRMTCQELYQSPLPLIAHWRFREFVVVTSVSGSTVEVHSPAEGLLALTKEEFEAGFTGVSICFTCDTGDIKSRSKLCTCGVFTSFPLLSAVLISAQLFIMVCCAATVLLLHGLAGALEASAQIPALLLCAAFAAVGLLQAAVSQFQLGLLGRCRDYLAAAGSDRVTAMLNSEKNVFFKKTSPYRMNAVAAGCYDVPQAVANSVFCLLQLFSAVACVLMLAAQDLWVAAAAVVITIVYSAAAVRGWKTLLGDEKRSDRDRFCLIRKTEASLKGMEQAGLHGGTQKEFEGFLSEAYGAYQGKGIAMQRLLWGVFAAAMTLSVLCAALLRVVQGAVGLPALFGSLYLAVILLLLMSALPRLLCAQARAKSRLEEYGLVFAQEQPDAGASAALQPPETLSLQNASLHAAGIGEPILRDITFYLRKGELLVVLDGSAQSRALLAQAASGREKPFYGELYLGRMKASEAKEQDVFAAVTLIGEGIPCPEGSIRENIAESFGKTAFTDHDIEEAAARAMLHERILNHTGGYDAPAGSLSEGERILLEFACAFARQSQFLVADNITSKLDRDTEATLLASLRENGVGVVLITADEELTHKADRVCFIEKGLVTLKERSEFIGREVQTVG